eukprot:m.67895 g.67895  ORF g.67895 m.67895 type:complete len:587 (+) comp23883_c0_seq2:283-2043(+)
MMTLCPSLLTRVQSRRCVGRLSKQIHLSKNNLPIKVQIRLNQTSTFARSGYFGRTYARLASSKFVAVATGIVGGYTVGFIGHTAHSALFGPELSITEAGNPKQFTFHDVRQHNAIENRVWVTYGSSVYDITEFVESHPGGKERILLAAGGPLEPFWNLYQIHTSTSWNAVKEILENCKIGDLAPSEVTQASQDVLEDIWAGEPDRHPALVVRGNSPFNAETPLTLINGSYTTPNELFFTRHHHPVPSKSIAQEYKLGIELPLELQQEGKPKTIEFSLKDLKENFKKHTIVATIQCGGNRRGQLGKAGKTEGIQWSAGAISTAEWGGAKLSDVLEYAGVSQDDADKFGLENVQFIPMDNPYDASIPMHKATDKRGDVLLAYEMNGDELSREHGYPIRAVVPGYIGARSVKWLQKIVPRKDEAVSNWQRGIPYKAVSPNIKSFKGVDIEKVGFSVQELPVQSAITEPNFNRVVDLDKNEPTVQVQGFAWSGGGRSIKRVDVSPDGGQTWQTAELQGGHDQAAGRAWAWTLWTIDLELPQSVVRNGKTELVCKAVDSSCNQQPENVESVWNLRGILNNAWHRVEITVDT